MNEETKMSAASEKKALSFFNVKMITALLPALMPFAPMILVALGSKLKSKDADAIGADDAFGDILIALAPAVSSIGDRDESKVKQALRVARDAINSYLGE